MSAASLLPFVLMFAVFYFLLIRPQQRKSKHRNSMLSSLKKGDKIVTIGGMHGTILEISDDKVVLRVNDSTKITFDRSAINNVTSTSAATSAVQAAPVVEKEEEKADNIKA
ncbi:preprotein translocase subunit YajC [Paenibacillus sp. OV219]|uniref:preprotein translocase subunit YajC n=1 Tax=Paenibacillus sp. OV219 TaxID=1884377 RepID=UPI0008C0A0C3|nr:preprotein translocase subunit YajC [Paenibacillus sp. OV219]SEM68589.1 preprotein translocase subunit YajC [Paenibacillus sp. OV219]